MSYLDFIAENWPAYLSGLWTTLLLAALALLIGLPVGALFAVVSLSANRFIRYVMITIVELGRGVPSIIVLYLVYFGLPEAGLLPSAFAAGAIGLAFTTAAYSSEIMRAGIKEVPVGQFEASSALALSWSKQLLLVVLPQAIQKVVPPLIGLSIGIFQATALAYAITVPELLGQAYMIAGLTFEWTPALLTAGAIYAIFTLSVIVCTRSISGYRRRRITRTARSVSTLNEENHEVPA
ncbi:amino acid ABC transporter permease [Arthrobacter sp. R3-55]